MKRCIHLKTGKEYYFLGSTSIKIPIINYWFHFTKYQDMITEACYYRFHNDFLTNFNLKE